jgi:hypothetical protein
MNELINENGELVNEKREKKTENNKKTPIFVPLFL